MFKICKKKKNSLAQYTVFLRFWEFFSFITWLGILAFYFSFLCFKCDIIKDDIILLIYGFLFCTL